MKQLIISFFIIAALLVFFFIVDRKEFSRNDDLRIVPTENQETRMAAAGRAALARRPTMTITEDSVEEEDRLNFLETKNKLGSIITDETVVFLRKSQRQQSLKLLFLNRTLSPRRQSPQKAPPASALTNSVTELISPDETKPADETKHVTGKESVVPTAIPLLSPEEAEKANDYALFISKAQKEKKLIVVEGTIEERSELPDPAQSDYPDCRFTAHFIGNAIKSGESCPKEVSLIIEGFADYTVLENDSIQKGDKVLCSMILFDCLPEDEKSTQQADDLDLYLLASYYAIDIKKINHFEDNEFMPRSGIAFQTENEEYISIFDRHLNPPVSNKYKEAQQAAIEDDQKRMDLILSEWNDKKIKETNERFAEAWKQEKAKDPSGYNRVCDGKFVWRNIDNSFWCLPEDYTLIPEIHFLSNEILECFSALKQMLEANGVQLIVTLVPDLYVISSRVINKDFRDIPDLQTAVCVKQLSEIGIETLYSSDLIIQNHNRYPFAFFYPDDGHPSDTTQDVLTDHLATRLKRYDIEPSLDQGLFSEKQNYRHFMYSLKEKYYWPGNCDIASNEPNTGYSCRQILYDNQAIPRTKNAPLIIFGNSYSASPMGGDSGTESFPTLTSFKTLSPIDWHRSSSVGVLQEALKQLCDNPDFFLKEKKVAVFVFSTKHIIRVDKSNLMFNFSKADHDRMVLGNKKTVMSLQSFCNTDHIISGNSEDIDKSLKSLQNKSLFLVDSKGEIEIAHVDIENDTFNKINRQKELILLIQAVCSSNQTCTVSANDKTETVPSYSSLASFHNILFVFPADTRELILKVKGKPGTVLAIKDIQIWQ